MRLRKINYLSLLALIVVLNFSCGNDDDTESIKADIIGIWEWDSGSVNGEIIIYSDCEQKNTVQFKSDGVIIFTEYNGEDCMETSTTGENDKYTVNGNLVKVFYNGSNTSSEQFTILEVTDFKLKSTGEEDGITYIMEYIKLE